MPIVKWPIPIIGKLADNRCTSRRYYYCYWLQNLQSTQIHACLRSRTHWYSKATMRLAGVEKEVGSETVSEGVIRMYTENHFKIPLKFKGLKVPVCKILRYK